MCAVRSIERRKVNYKWRVGGGRIALVRCGIAICAALDQLALLLLLLLLLVRLGRDWMLD